jgi:hypothetical protein
MDKFQFTLQPGEVKKINIQIVKQQIEIKYQKESLKVGYNEIKKEEMILIRSLLLTASFMMSGIITQSTVSFTLPVVTLMDIEPAGNITLNFIAPTEAGNALTNPRLTHQNGSIILLPLPQEDLPEELLLLLIQIPSSHRSISDYRQHQPQEQEEVHWELPQDRLLLPLTLLRS